MSDDNRERNLLNAHDTFQNQVLSSNGSSLVEAADIHATGIGNAEGFSTEYS